MNDLDRDKLIEAAKRAAADQNRPISRAEFERITGISQYHIYRLFPEGGWSELKRLADLEKHPKNNEPLGDDDLLEEFHRVATEIARVPTWTLFSHHAHISADVVRRRFGGLQGTLERYRRWLADHDPESPILAELGTQSRHEVPSPPPQEPGNATTSSREPWAKGDGPEYGPPMDFRGFRHAPINEQGVVFLFGMVSYELGFIVEAVHASYPDCEAKRQVANDRWQRVRIEFEYRSRSFKDHGHDAEECDLIVCWEHNWPDCPLEVVELRRVINQLDG